MTLRGMVVILLAAAGLAAGPVSAGTHGPRVQTEIARYTFNRAGSGTLVISGSARIVPGAVFAVVDVDMTDPQHPKAWAPTVVDLGTFSGVDTYGAIQGHRLCPAPLTCSVRNGEFIFNDSFQISGTAGSMRDEEYVVLRGADVQIADQVLHGWTAKHRHGGLLRRTDADAGGAGLSAGDGGVSGYDAGVNTGVSAPGPAAGSIAIAVPACEDAGVGVLQLTGGVQQPSAVCPSDAIADVAAHATTWSATGAVAGASENTSRLLVITR